ncbi:MAG: SRPBCC family protein [Fermentimonas sp.]|nr:SRPBCC family protein [Fermentimonas sp.]
MTEFASEVKVIPHKDSDVFRVLSDLRNLELIKGMIPEDKIKDFNFDNDSVSFTVDSIGKVAFEVTDRQPDNLVVFKSLRLPFDIVMELHLLSLKEKETEFSMQVKSNLNPFMRGLVEKPMREAIERISEALANLPYDRI